MHILILNGPNLNLLGKREPGVYGNQDFESYLSELKRKFPEVKFDYIQSNNEAFLVDAIHAYGFTVDGIVFNAGAYTHTSVAIADAISGINSPVVEVHISNVYARENFRHHSYLGPVCQGSLSGFGLKGYELAVLSLLK